MTYGWSCAEEQLGGSQTPIQHQAGPAVYAVYRGTPVYGPGPQLLYEPQPPVVIVQERDEYIVR